MQTNTTPTIGRVIVRYQGYALPGTVLRTVGADALVLLDSTSYLFAGRIIPFPLTALTVAP